MELYAKGQLSFLILNCLLERDFYGLDIISEISARSNGNINLKKPSVYSNLTRMEKQGFVSAYLKSSDVGPNRKYYSITEKGRNFFKELKEYFDRNNIDVFRDFKDSELQEKNSVQIDITNYDISSNDKIDDEVNEEVNEIEEDNDYFDFSTLDESNQSNNTIEENVNSAKEFDERQEHFNSFIHNTQTEEEQETTSVEIQEEIDKVEEVVENSPTQDTSIIESPISNQEENKILETVIEESLNTVEEEKKDDAVFLSTQDASEYNKRLYDISKDINKYKNKRSFAEDQISISVDTPIYLSNEKTKANIQELKSSIENKSETINQYDYSKQMNYRFNEPKKEDSSNKEVVKDDAKYITNSIDSSTLERAKKIEPPRLKILDTPVKESKLPAPKRDTSIDPSHKEILSKLYSKTKDESSESVREDAIYDYNDLKDFYKSQNISFNEYKKSGEKKSHNTNLLYLIISVATFLFSSLVSGILYLILSSTKQLFTTTNFLFILLPALLIIDIAWNFYNYKKYSGWLPSQMLPQWKIWCITLSLIAGIIGLNVIFGLGFKPFNNYSNTLLLPILLILIVLPLRYYFKRFILVKFWR